MTVQYTHWLHLYSLVAVKSVQQASGCMAASCALCYTASCGLKTFQKGHTQARTPSVLSVEVITVWNDMWKRIFESVNIQITILFECHLNGFSS